MQSLAVGALESLDEGTGFGNHLLLFVVLLLLLSAALGTQFKIVRIGGFVVVDFAHSHFDGAGGDMVDKGSVVRDNHHSSVAFNKEIFEPLN